MKLIDFGKVSLDHDVRSIEYWVTHGIEIDNETYAIVKMYKAEDGIHGILTKDGEFYDHPLFANADLQGKYDEMKSKVDELETMVTDLSKRVHDINVFDGPTSLGLLDKVNVD